MTPAPSQGTRWRVVLILTMAGALAGAHVYKLSPALPVLRADMDLGLVAAGWLFSLVNLLSLVFGIIAGTLSDRLGHRRVLVTGLVVMGVASLAGSFAAGQAGLLFWRFLEGVGFLTVVIAAPSLIAGEARGPDRSIAFGIWGTYLPVGAALVVLAAPYVIAVVGWRGLWQVTAALSLVLLVMVIRVRPGPGRSEDATLGTALPAGLVSNVIRTLSSRGPWLPALGFGLYTLQFTALMSWLPTYMVEQRGIAHGTAGMLAAIVIAVNIPGNLIGGMLLRRGWSHGAVVTLASLLMVGATVMIFSATIPDPWRYTGCLILSLIGGMIPASVLGAGPVMSPSTAQLGTTNGLIVQGANMGNVLGPPLLAALTTINGRWEDAIWMFAVAALLNMGLGHVMRREEKRRGPFRDR